MKQLLSLIILFLVFTVEVVSQPAEDTPNPKIAFLKSLAVPGWGHHYVDNNKWQRGQYHLAADAVLILSYVGFSIHSSNIQQNWYSYGRQQAGVPIEGRSRQFQLAVGDFNSLQAYNDYQSRSRNWDQLYEDTPENRWQWSSSEDRMQYRNLRSRFERIDQQLPALLGLMVVNRIISGISAYNRAQKKKQSNLNTAMFLSPYRDTGGVMANIRFEF
jgi:hypothetical protein